MTSCGNQKTHHHVRVTESGFVPFLLLVRNNLNFSQLSTVVWSRLSDIPCASSVEYRHACMCVQALTFTLTEASASKFWAWWNIVLKAALHKRIWRLRGTGWTRVNMRVPLQQRRLSVSWAGLARVQLAHQKKLLFFSIQYFLKSMPEIPCSSLLSAVRDEQWHITSPVRTTKLVRGLGACDIWGEAERTVVLKL